MELLHPVPREDSEAWVRALVTTFLGSPYDDDFPRRVDRWTRDWETMRTWGVRDTGRFVATLATVDYQLTIPAGGTATRDIGADALTGVTVAATHRRQGLLNRMMAASLQEAKDRGAPVAILIAAEWPIYGRYGYAPAIDSATITYHPRWRGGALPAPPPGRLRHVEPDELRQVAPAIFAAARRLRPGQIERPDDWWDRRFIQNGYEPIGKQPNWVLHEGDDGPDGYVGWSMTRDFDLNGQFGALQVADFVAANDEAYRELWAYLGGIDVVDEIKIEDRPLDEPIRFLLPDARAWQVSAVYDFLWLRLLDVPAALSARGYATAGNLVIEVGDPDPGGYAAGRFALETEGPTATCRPTDAAPDLRVTQRALAGAYLGGRRLHALALSGGVEELTPGALDRADVLFSVPIGPTNPTGF